MRGRQLLPFALFTVFGLLLFASTSFDDLARGHAHTILRRFIEEMTGVYSAFVLVPGVLSLARRFPVARQTWVRSIPIVFIAVLAFTVAHTTLMALSRSLVFALAHLGTYDYGTMAFRYPMEAAKDVIVFAGIYGWALAANSLERGRTAELAAAELQGELAEARFANLRLQLQPHFLFNTINAISAVMYEDVGRADAMLAVTTNLLFEK